MAEGISVVKELLEKEEEDQEEHNTRPEFEDPNQPGLSNEERRRIKFRNFMMQANHSTEASSTSLMRTSGPELHSSCGKLLVQDPTH